MNEKGHKKNLLDEIQCSSFVLNVKIQWPPSLSRVIVPFIYFRTQLAGNAPRSNVALQHLCYPVCCNCWYACVT